MIQISRSLARQFLAVTRRAGLGKRHAGSFFVRLISTADALRLQSTNGSVAIEHRTSGQFEAAEFTVPLGLFTDVETKSDALVTIRIGADRLIAEWTDHGVPQQREYPTDISFPEMPPVPTEWSTNGVHFLTALRDAKDIADHSATRYALECLQLKGMAGTIVATDARQVLVQSGLQFPWRDEVLMRATKVFASSELGSELPVEIGRTEKYVTVRVGEWTIHHEIESEGRFPQKIHEIIPSQDAIQTRMQIDAIDAKFLTATINRLPGDDVSDRPLTIDLNGAVIVRARKDEQSPMTELLLSRSKRVGNELRLMTNRAYLSRALELGFSEIGFVDAEKPCVCRDETRTYLWSLLEGKDSLKPSANVHVIDSMSMPSNGATNTRAATNPVQTSSSVVSTPVNRVAEHLPQAVVPATKPKSEVAVPPTAPQSADVIEQAIALRNQLRTITQGLNDLVIKIRTQRKQARLMKSTLQSIKQLQLVDA